MKFKRRLNFFKTNNKSQINHVGIVIEATDNEIYSFLYFKGCNYFLYKKPYYKKLLLESNPLKQGNS
jgi:hypothetical protein